MLRRLTKQIIRKLPKVGPLYRDLENQWVPPGHFYSPIASIDDVRRREDAIFDVSPADLAAVDLNDGGQLAHLTNLAPFAAEQPFTGDVGDGRRYHYGNGVFDYADGLLLYATIRWAQPKRVIEVGSGHSSCLILDAIDEHPGQDAVSCTFIEPYPDLLRTLLRTGDLERARLDTRPFQEIDVGEFTALEANDILFVDSTHVSKVGSDVNHLFFNVLPRLAPGVLVHIHDVFFPFEYRKDWVYEGRAWNELYLLRSFLQYNSAFNVLLFVDHLRRFHWETLLPLLPATWDVTDWALGSSLWLQKTR